MRIAKIAAALLCLFFVSCQSAPEIVPPEIYWPLPPERPRVKFLDFIMGSLDVTGGRGDKFTNLLFGDVEDERFVKPSFVAVRGGVMYVTDIDRVHVYDFGERKYRVEGYGVLRTATGIAVSSDGRIYVGDSSLHKVVVITPGSTNVRLAGDEGLLSPGGLALDEVRGRFFAADAKAHDVKVFSLDGDYLFTMGERGYDPGTFNFPYDVALDRSGNIYVVDSGNFRVQIFNPDGEFITYFGNIGAEPGTFSRPKSIALDSDGYIYVVDAAFGNIQIFDAAGRVYMSFGTNGVNMGEFLLPMGIYIDGDDKLYVVDQANKRVQLFQCLKYEDERVIKPPDPAELLF